MSNNIDSTPHEDRSSLSDASAETTLHQERAEVSTRTQDAGRVRVRKNVSTHEIEQVVPRDVEHADTSERVTATEGDSGEIETLEDGSVSIPIFEEVLVVTKRLVVRERVIVRKTTVVDEYRLQTDLRREHVTIKTDGDIDVEDRRDRGAEGGTADDGTEEFLR